VSKPHLRLEFVWENPFKKLKVYAKNQDLPSRGLHPWVKHIKIVKSRNYENIWLKN